MSDVWQEPFLAIVEIRKDFEPERRWEMDEAATPLNV